MAQNVTRIRLLELQKQQRASGLSRCRAGAFSRSARRDLLLVTSKAPDMIYLFASPKDVSRCRITMFSTPFFNLQTFFATILPSRETRCFNTLVNINFIISTKWLFWHVEFFHIAFSKLFNLFRFRKWIYVLFSEKMFVHFFKQTKT